MFELTAILKPSKDRYTLLGYSHGFFSKSLYFFYSEINSFLRGVRRRRPFANFKGRERTEISEWLKKPVDRNKGKIA